MDNHSGLHPQDWHQRHWMPLWRCALAKLRDPDLAADLVQDTLLAAWEAREGFAGRASERTWLISILRHKMADHLRRRATLVWRSDDRGSPLTDREGRADPRTEELTCVAARFDAEKRMLAHERLEEVAAAIDDLPAQMANALTLHTLRDRTAGDVCEEMGISRSHFSVLLHRARRRLRVAVNNAE